MAWAVLPGQIVDNLISQYKESKEDVFLEKTYDARQYYVMIDAEEMIFPSDTLEEEKPFLEAGIKQLLYTHIKAQNPKLISIEVSKLQHSTFWQKGAYVYHMAYVEKQNVKALFEKRDLAVAQSSPVLQIGSSDIKDTIKDKITHLEAKQKQYPKNIDILQKLKALYKILGDVEGYETVNERIMDVKMDI